MHIFDWSGIQICFYSVSSFLHTPSIYSHYSAFNFFIVILRISILIESNTPHIIFSHFSFCSMRIARRIHHFLNVCCQCTSFEIRIDLNQYTAYTAFELLNIPHDFQLKQVIVQRSSAKTITFKITWSIFSGFPVYSLAFEITRIK